MINFHSTASGLMVMTNYLFIVVYITYPKYCKHSIEFVLMLFWADWAITVVLKISSILLNYPTFEVFFHIFMGDKI